MTDTPVSDVRTLIADEYARFLREEGARDRPWDFADGLAVIVTPVIRRQVAEEIALHLEDDCDDEAAAVARAHAIESYEARSHSTPKEQDHG